MTDSRSRAGHVALNLLVAVVFVLLISEFMLRLPPLLGRDPAAPERDPMRSHVLAVGDSLTRTHGVPEEETYPGHLQELLDEAAPGRFRTVNLGVIGVSSSFVAKQLPSQIARYRPEFVIVWIGSNIRSDMEKDDDTDSRFSAGRFLRHSELFRFIQVWLHDRELEAQAAELAAKGATLSEAEALSANQERLRNQKAFLQTLDEDRMRELLARDYRRIVETARASGTEVILITYPFDLGPSARANAVMREMAAELDVPLVSSGDAAARVPDDERKWLWALHPTGPIYRELARDLATMILSSEVTVEVPSDPVRTDMAP